MMGAIRTFKHKTEPRVFKIFQDESPENPRSWDNLGVMICRHRDYSLGDTQLSKAFDGSFEDLKKQLIKEQGAVVILPLYLYDHSGISMSTGSAYPFNCPWDSSVVGYIFATEKKIKDEYKVKRITSALKKKVEAVLIQEVKIYSKYLEGEVYGYVLAETKTCSLEHEHEEQIDSVWGFFIDNVKELFEAADLNMNDWEESK